MSLGAEGLILYCVSACFPHTPLVSPFPLLCTSVYREALFCDITVHSQHQDGESGSMPC